MDSQFEKLKTAGEKIDDIFDHTDNKIAEVMQKVTKLYNKKRSTELDFWQDQDFRHEFTNTIAFDENYPREKFDFGNFIINKLKG